MNIEYPENCLRGISNKDFLDEDGDPTPSLFQFNKDARSDGYLEESINWLDDPGAIDQLFLQKKEDDSIQFKFGAAVLIRGEIDRIIRNIWVKNKLSYERSIKIENPYHGNLLLQANTKKRKRHTIAASLALASKEILANKYVRT